jgi:hypothetical protein
MCRLPISTMLPISSVPEQTATVGAIVTAYLDCSRTSTSPFKNLAAETQRTRRNFLKNFVAAHGSKRIFYMANGKRVMLLTAEHMQRIINEKASTPFGQRNLLNTLRAMFGWAVSEPRKRDSVVVFEQPSAEEVWDLAWRFRDYQHAFSHATWKFNRCASGD